MFSDSTKIRFWQAVKRRADRWLVKNVGGWKCPRCNLWTWEDRLAKSQFINFENEMLMLCSNCNYTSRWLFGPAMINLE